LIRDKLAAAVGSAATSIGLDPSAAAWTMERPARREHGDWSCNLALVSAKSAGRPPREIASELVDALRAVEIDHVEDVSVAGPGFVNFHLAPTWLHDVLVDVVESGTEGYARLDTLAGEKVMVEFVSANPTGPIHVGNGWFASYGDSVARLLERSGAQVHREYYVNDTGGQIRRLGESVLARAEARPVPDGGYPSGFVKGLASSYDGPHDVEAAGRWAAQKILGFIRLQMEMVNIHFDEWYSQASIEESEAVHATLESLRQKDLVWEEDGATWLNTGEFGDPRERRVVRKSAEAGGDYTYLAGDLAYHRDKFLVRGFDRVVNVWGADHQGQVSSLLAGVEALGVERGRLEVRLGQMVSLASGRIGKRLGNAVDLDDLVDEIGPDVMRLLSLVASVDQSPTIDLDAVRERSSDSPVYYVQYAHARIASINRRAEQEGITRRPLRQIDLSVLTHGREIEVMRTLSELPDIVEIATRERAPHKVTAWVRELADRFHGFYHDCYVIGDVPPDVTQARMWLVESARIGFAIGLDLLGVSAPDRM
jgi:arginyl-tRNA synthetase